MINIDLDKLRLKDKGYWAVTATYAIDDYVYHNGSTYLCLVAHIGVEPDANSIGTEWSYLGRGQDALLQYDTLRDGKHRFKLLFSNYAPHDYMIAVTITNKVYFRGQTGHKLKYNNHCSQWLEICFPQERKGKNIIDIKSGYFRCYVLYDDGDLYAWGHNQSGGCADGTTTDRYIPWKIMGNVKRIEVAIEGFGQTYDWAAALDYDGQLWSWGYNGYGECGLGHQTSPIKIATKVPNGDDVLDYSICGTQGGHMAVVKSNGDLWTCGYNGQGQLGLGHTTTMNQLERVEDMRGICKKVYTSGSLYNVRYATSYVWTIDNRIMTAGKGGYGMLGQGSTADSYIFREMNQNFSSFPVKKMIIPGGAYTACFYIDESDTLWGWGNSNYSQLGFGNTTQQNQPVISHANVKDCWLMQGGYNSYTKGTFIRTTDNELKGVGQNGNGPMGPRHDNELTSWTPIEIPFPVEDIIAHSSCGYSEEKTNYFLFSNGFIAASGYNEQGQVSNGDQCIGRREMFIESTR